MQSFGYRVGFLQPLRRGVVPGKGALVSSNTLLHFGWQQASSLGGSTLLLRIGSGASFDLLARRALLDPADRGLLSCDHCAALPGLQADP